MKWLSVVILIVLCSACLDTFSSEQSETGTGPTASSKRIATINTSPVKGELVPGHPWHALAMKTNDPGAYGQMFRLAEDSPYEFLQKLQDGSCILLPDGTRVEVKQPSPGTRLMWRIRHKGKDWWIIGAFMLDTNGVRMDLKYKDK